MNIKYIVGILCLLVLLVAPVSADVVTHLWTVSNDTATPTTSDISKDGSWAMVGFSSGNITMYYAGNGSGSTSLGTVKWKIKGNVNLPQRIDKVKMSYEGEYFVALNTTEYVLYGDASTGSKLWSYNVSRDIRDVDISDDGEYVGMVITGNTTTVSNIVVLNKSGYKVADRVLDLNAAGTPTSGDLEKIVVDHSNRYVFVTLNTSTSYYSYTFDDNRASWYQDYKYRKSFVITSSAGDARYYPINVSIYNTTGTSSGAVVYIGKNVTALDWDDIRFTTSDGVTRVNQWYRQQFTDHVNYSVIPSFVVDSTPTTFYMYYGNSSAGQYSNVTNSTDEIPASWGSVSNIVNFDAESTPGTGWSFENYSYYYGSSTGKYSTIWKTNGSTSRRLWGYGEAGGGFSGYSIAFSNNTFTLNAISSSLYNRYNLSFTAQCNAQWQKDIFDNWYRSAYHDIYINNTLVFTNHTDMSGAVSGTTYGPTEYGYAYLEPDMAYNFSIYSYTYAYAVSDSPDVYTTFYVDNLTLKYTGAISTAPTIGSWGTVESKLGLYDASSGTVTGNVILIDQGTSGDKLGLSTESHYYDFSLSSAGVVTGSSGTAVTANTPTDMKVTASDNFAIETRNIQTNIMQYGPSIVGTFTHGSTATHCDIDTDNGLWSITSSNDNHIYVFSKANSTDWYYAWGAALTSTPSTVSMSNDGGFFLYGESSGSVYYYETIASADTTTSGDETYIYLHVMKDNAIPYSGANVSVYYGGSTGEPYGTFVGNYSTDATGSIYLSAIATHYYKFNVWSTGAIEGTINIVATKSQYDFYIYISTPKIYTPANASAYWNNSVETTGDVIYLDYTDNSGNTEEIHWIVWDLYDNTVVKDTTVAGSTSHTTYTVGNQSSTYKVVCEATRSDGHVDTRTWMVFSPNKSCINVPIPAELRLALVLMFALITFGLFARVHAAVGAIIGWCMLNMFQIICWINIPIFWNALVFVLLIMNVIRRGGE